MAKRDANAYLVTVTVTISVVLFLSGYVPILMDPSKEKDNELPGFVLPTLDDDFWPADPPPQESLVIPPGDAISIKPIQEGLSGEISIPSESSEVKDLDFLEGLSKFSNKRPWGPGCGTGLGPTYYSPENIALSISQQTMATKPEGEFEKGVSICFEEDILYLLDKDRGLVVVDISNPYLPEVVR